jgi:hypothetical protein
MVTNRVRSEREEMSETSCKVSPNDESAYGHARGILERKTNTKVPQYPAYSQGVSVECGVLVMISQDEDIKISQQRGGELLISRNVADQLNCQEPCGGTQGSAQDARPRLSLKRPLLTPGD